MEMAEKLLALGLDVSLNPGPNGIEATFHSGFYKSDGIVKLWDKDGELRLETRYDELDIINEPMDVVRVSKRWWDYSKNRYDGWKAPAYGWAELYKKLP